MRRFLLRRFTFYRVPIMDMDRNNVLMTFTMGPLRATCCGVPVPARWAVRVCEVLGGS